MRAPLPRLQPGDPGPGLAHLAPDLGKRRAPRLADQAALVDAERRLVDEGGLERLGDARSRSSTPPRRPHQRIGECSASSRSAGQRAQRGPRPARSRGVATPSQPGGEAREVARTPTSRSRIPSASRAGSPASAPTESRRSPTSAGNRSGRRSHCRRSRPPIAVNVRSIAPEESPGAAAVLEALDDLEVARRALVERQVVIERERLDAREVRRRRLLGLVEVLRGPRRPRAPRRPGAAGPALDRGDAEVGRQTILALPEAEGRGVHAW